MTGVYHYIGLMKVTAQSFTPQPITILLESVYDVCSWLAPFIDELHDHRQPHYFCLTMNKDGQAVMHYIQSWSDDGWSNEELLLLTVRKNTIHKKGILGHF